MKRNISLILLILTFFINKISKAQSCVGGTTLAVSIQICEGIASEMPDDVRINPNPATNAINIYLNNRENYSLVFTDITGKVLLVQQNISNSFSINTSAYSNGIYFIRLLNEKQKVIVHKIEIQK